MIDRTSREAIVDAIYDAALDSHAWPEALAKVAAHVGGVGTDFYLFQDNKLAFSSIGGISEEAVDEYLAVYHGRTERSRALAMVDEGRLISDLEFVPPADLSRNAFYADFLRRWDIRLFLGGCPLKTATAMCMFGVHFPLRKRSLSAGEYRAVGALVPHLRRASKIHLRIGDLQSAQHRLSDVLDTIALPLVLVDHRCRIEASNAAASDLLGQNGPLRIDGRLLTARYEDENLLLRETVQGIARGESRGDLPLHGIAGSPVVVVTGCPLPTWRRFEEHADVLLLLSSPGLGSHQLEVTLRERYDLTIAEAQLAAWIVNEGGSLRGWSKKRTVSYETARSHLKRLLPKVGIFSQTDLIRRLLLGAAALRPPQR